jgi:8-oxo-dGTP pyrophosphatase MutT (NUDIX family)
MTYFFPPTLPHYTEKYYRRGKKIPKGFYRLTVKALIVNEKWEILILKEGKYSDKKSEFYRDDAWLYDLPGWGLEYGEDFSAGLARELEEEIGIKKWEYEMAKEPLYVFISEIDDRYHDDMERDDFYPVCMFIYPTKLAHFDFHESPECSEYEWVSLEKFRKYPIWTHSKTLEKYYRFSDFPKKFIS